MVSLFMFLTAYTYFMEKYTLITNKQYTELVKTTAHYIETSLYQLMHKQEYQETSNVFFNQEIPRVIATQLE